MSRRPPDLGEGAGLSRARPPRTPPCRRPATTPPHRSRSAAPHPTPSADRSSARPQTYPPRPAASRPAAHHHHAQGRCHGRDQDRGSRESCTLAALFAYRIILYIQGNVQPRLPPLEVVPGPPSRRLVAPLGAYRRPGEQDLHGQGVRVVCQEDLFGAGPVEGGEQLFVEKPCRDGGTAVRLGRRVGGVADERGGGLVGSGGRDQDRASMTTVWWPTSSALSSLSV